MKRLHVAWGILLVLAAAPAWGQNATVKTAAPEASAPKTEAGVPPPPMPSAAPYVSPGSKAAAETGSYEVDAKTAVRRLAEARNEQRQRRLASLRWFGLSNTRPQASPDPWNGDYSPHWTSNNPFNPYQWAGGTQSPPVIRAVQVQLY